MADFDIREIETFDDIDACMGLQRETWGLPDADLTPPRLFVMARWSGTPPLGAFDSSGALLGFLHTLPSRFGGTPSYYSHMLAVAESHRDHGVGYALKLEQRRRALADGVDLVVWTFDPLQSRNAHFNINKLGAVVGRYVENFYGERHASVFDAGIGSDRVFAEWWIASDRVRQAIEGGAPAISSRDAVVEIPSDFAAVKRADLDEAVTWRRESRARFQRMIGDGFVAVALDRDIEAGTSRYVFVDAERLRDEIR